MKKSFTLIELIVVIAIIAILAAIIAPNAFKAIEKAKIAQAVADFRTLKKVWQTFAVDVGRFPTEGGAADEDYAINPVMSETHLLQETVSGANTPTFNGWDGPYIETAPKFPWGSRPEYRYDNDRNCYPDDDPLWAGINVIIELPDTGLTQTQFEDIVLKIDAILDGGDGIASANGNFRGSASQAIDYLIDDGC